MKKIDKNEKNGNKCGIISLLLFFGSNFFIILIYFFPFLKRLTSIVGLLPLVGIVMMIDGRVKYPNNKLLKVAMWLIIISIILSVIAFIVFIVSCVISCKNMDTSGCS